MNRGSLVCTFIAVAPFRQAVSWDGNDQNDDSEYGDPYEQYDSIDDDALEEESSGLCLDRQYFMPPSMQLYTTFGCMMISNRIDFFNPRFVRLVRYVRAFGGSWSCGLCLISVCSSDLLSSHKL